MAKTALRPQDMDKMAAQLLDEGKISEGLQMLLEAASQVDVILGKRDDIPTAAIQKQSNRLTRAAVRSMNHRRLDFARQAVDLAKKHRALHGGDFDPWLEFQLLFEEHDQDKAWTLCQNLLGEGTKPTTSRGLQNLFNLALNKQDWDLAMETAQHSLDTRGAKPWWTKAFYNAYCAKSGLDCADELRDLIFAEGNESAHCIGLVVGFGVGIFELDELVEYLKIAEERWGDSKSFARFNNRINRMTGTSTYITQMLEGNTLLPEVFRGAGDETRALKRPLVAYTLGDEIAHSPKTDGDILIRFAGLGVNLNPLETDLCASALNLNATYIYDPLRVLYISGVPSVGGTFEGLRDYLADHIARLGGNRRLTVIGSSAGGFAAILYGIALGADRIVTFSPLTITDHETMHRIGEYRGRAIAHRMDTQPVDAIRNIPNYLDTLKDTPPIDVVFGDAFPEDVAQATALGHIPNVSLHPIHGFRQHDTWQLLFEAGIFGQVLAGDMSNVANALSMIKNPQDFGA